MTARAWSITLPWATPPVKPNGGHGNVYAHAKKVRTTRQAMGLRRDVDNLAWTLKPLCDALAGTKAWDHQIVPNDTPEWMEKPMPAIIYRPGEPKEMVLTVTEILPNS